MMQGKREHAAPRTPHAPLNMIPVYKTLQEIKASSPSRKHGLSEEDEDRWRRAAVNLIVTAGLAISMDETALYTAIEFFHRYYAEHSMVTNDRFLMAMACMYLGGKVADFPKSSRDIIYGCVDTMCTTHKESSQLRSDSEWMKQTRQALNDAERALLYQLGYRFAWQTSPMAVANILGDKTYGNIGDFILKYFEDKPEEERKQFNRMAYLLALESVKVQLILQYPAEAIAAVCIWMAMKMLKITGSPPALVNPKTGQSKQWYHNFGLEAADLDIIADQISGAVVGDVEAMQEIVSGAMKVSKVEFIKPSLVGREGNNNGGGGGGGGGGR